MATMKYPNVSGGTNMAVSGNGSHVDEVDSLFTSTCWQNSNMNLQNDFIDTHSLTLDSSMSNLGADKLLLDSPISHDDNEIETDALDKLFLTSQPTNSSLAELKPLPPFTGYTANLSINGIQGHHYHTISQRIPEENNNSYNTYNEQNIVSSSTCNVSADSAGDCAKTMYSVDGYSDCANPDSVSSAKMYEDCSHPSADSVTHIKTEIAEYDISIDFANIIGSAMADTTVPNTNPETEDATGSRDSWMDIDAFIGETCGEQKNLIITQDGLSEFGVPVTQPQQGGSTLQTLLTHGYMPLLQNRLQNGPPIKQEAPSSTNFSSDLITTSSPPANVVSTTDNLLLTVNGRFMPQYGVQMDRIRSPDLLGQNYPHTTTTNTPNAPKKSRSRAQKKQAQASTTVFQNEQNLGLLGKEKPVHRCSICNRGFLNKSNIKVHLRTHTGEKPFRCDTCAKAFRQKAHLLKHQQIHKRIGRD
ncbi:ichor [Tribolium madens]|uniref:ichor n=1 Tax=Tribolium madens TaxID=41895 RepID=UPI001CF73EEA|nr:ichor [Tribolium madens]